MIRLDESVVVVHHEAIMLLALVVPEDDGDFFFLERDLRKTLEPEECCRFITEVKTFHA